MQHGAGVSTGPKSAITSAIDKLDLESLRVILEHGGDPNQFYKIPSNTESLCSPENICNKNDEIETPLQNAASLQICPPYVTPLFLENIKSPMIKLLLKYGADPLQPLRDGKSTVLYEIAAKNGLVKEFILQNV